MNNWNPVGLIIILSSWVRLTTYRAMGFYPHFLPRAHMMWRCGISSKAQVCSASCSHPRALQGQGSLSLCLFICRSVWCLIPTRHASFTFPQSPGRQPYMQAAWTEFQKWPIPRSPGPDPPVQPVKF